MWKGLPAHSFLPAVSQRALKSISRTVKRWRLHLRFPITMLLNAARTGDIDGHDEMLVFRL